jgi:hypothetical protein
MKGDTPRKGDVYGCAEATPRDPCPLATVYRRYSMKRIPMATAMALAATLVLSTHAFAAGPPTIVFFPPGDVDFGNLNEGPAGAVCDFPVGLVLHVSRGAHEIQFDGQGVGFAARDAGKLSATVTNLDTGESVLVNISGPGWLNGDFLPVIGTGPWVIFEPIDQGGIRFFHGRIRLVPVSYGVHAIPLSGTEENLCDRVA